MTWQTSFLTNVFRKQAGFCPAGFLIWPLEIWLAVWRVVVFLRSCFESNCHYSTGILIMRLKISSAVCMKKIIIKQHIRFQWHPGMECYYYSHAWPQSLRFCGWYHLNWQPFWSWVHHPVSEFHKCPQGLRGCWSLTYTLQSPCVPYRTTSGLCFICATQLLYLTDVH